MDQTDRQIIELLRMDGRRSNVEIARALGISEGTVRKRVDRLLTGGVLRVVAVADPAAVGLRTHTAILLTVVLAQTQEVARHLSAMPEVMTVYRLTGGYDILVEAVFESDQQLMAFLSERLASVPGIIGSKICHVPQILKQRHDWVLLEPPPPAVLVVDDDPDFVEATRLVLTTEGYSVRVSASGRAAIASMSADPPDLVIMDVMMEGILDGWDATRRIRSDPRLRDLPVLVVSSITSSDYLGMVPTDDGHLIDNFLSKPVAPSQLLAEVKRLLKRR